MCACAWKAKTSFSMLSKSAHSINSYSFSQCIFVYNFCTKMKRKTKQNKKKCLTFHCHSRNCDGMSLVLNGRFRVLHYFIIYKLMHQCLRIGMCTTPPNGVLIINMTVRICLEIHEQTIIIIGTDCICAHVYVSVFKLSLPIFPVLCVPFPVVIFFHLRERWFQSLHEIIQIRNHSKCSEWFGTNVLMHTHTHTQMHEEEEKILHFEQKSTKTGTIS